MAKQPRKPRRPPAAKTEPKLPAETPPGATRKALERPMDRGGGPPGSAGGSRHAVDDEGTENETTGALEVTRTPASPPKRGQVFSDPDAEPTERESSGRIPPSKERDGIMRLIGYDAIEYAEKHSLPLNKHPDSINGPRTGLTIAEAEAIADEDAELIWLDVDENEYYSGPPVSYDPEY
jgi:hypothetical protein